MFSYAIARKPGDNFTQGLTTTGCEHGHADHALVLQQHDAYVNTLRACGLDVVVLDALAEFPDAYFVEDTAVVTPDVAIITRPGAPSRQGEEEAIATVLAPYRKTTRIQSPGTVDGGDVFMVGTRCFIGRSERTNQDGAAQLGQILETFGNTWVTIPVVAGLHLKSSVNYIGNDTLLLTEDFAGMPEFNEYQKIIVAQTDEYACNTLWINDHLLTPKGFPETRKKLERLGYEIIELDMSEVRKMDGGLSCLSIRF